MIKKIGTVTYDTENAAKIGAVTEGCFGDAGGYEETLYQNKRRLYFFHGIGGCESKYPSEDIIPVKAADAKIWIEQHCLEA